MVFAAVAAAQTALTFVCMTRGRRRTDVKARRETATVAATPAAQQL